MKEITKEFNNTELGKKYRKAVIIVNIILFIVVGVEIYSFIDGAFDINNFSEEIRNDISLISTNVLLISLIFDARYYGALAQYKEDRK